MVQAAQRNKSSKKSTTTATTTAFQVDSFEPPAVKAMKESLKKHGSNGNGKSNKNNNTASSSSFLKRNGNNNKKNTNSGSTVGNGTGTAGSTPPKESRSSPTNGTTTASSQENVNKIRSSSSSSPTNPQHNNTNSTAEATTSARSPLSTPTTATATAGGTTTTTVSNTSATTGADNSDANHADAIPPSSTLAMRTPLQLLRTSRSAIEAPTTTTTSSRSTSPNLLNNLVVTERSVLRRQSSLPATPSSSIVGNAAGAAGAAPNSSISTTATTTVHRLDRFGFIVNMDRHGNIVPDKNDNDDNNDATADHDGRNNARDEIQPDHQNAAKSPGRGGRRRRIGSGSAAALSASAQQQQPLSATALVKRTKKREQKWQFMMDRWSVTNLLLLGQQQQQQQQAIVAANNHQNIIKTRRRRKVITRLRKGLPDKYRGILWKLLGNVPQKMKDNVGLYQLLVQRATHSAFPITPTATTTADHQNTGNDHSTTTTAGTTVSTGSSGGVAVGGRTNTRNLPDSVEVDTETNLEEGLMMDNGEKNTKNANISSIAGPSSVRHSKSFRNIQDTIERDIHRTFPRHSMFYEEEKNHGSSPAHVQGSGGGGSSSGRVASGIDGAGGGGLLADFSASHFSEEDNLMLCGIGSEISETMRELERGAAGAASAVTATVGAAVAATNAATNHLGDNGLLLFTTEQQQRQQQQKQRDLVNNDDSDNPSSETILQSVGGQASLRRVLKAYSLYDRDIGYCQGMNFIAGMFLTLMSEEEAFWLLVDIMNEPPCKMRGLFGEGMSETHQVLHVAEKLIQQFLPKLSKHLDRELIHVTMFATQWLLTQYTSSFKFDLVTRVWDCFLAEGWKITYRVMLALLKQWEGEILKMSFEDILAFFRELPERIDDVDALMELAVNIPLRRSHIAKYEKEWGQMQQQQQQQQQQQAQSR